MKFQKLPVKRRSVKKGAFRTLFANVAKKKKRQRASTAASASDLDSDVPNLGVARGLVVILMIHVVAIAGIFFHSHFLDGDADKEVATTKHDVSPVVPAPRKEEAKMPKITETDSVYTVGTGDTYENIASRFGLSENELRLANDNIELRAGRYLRIPPKKIVAVEPPEITELRASNRPPVVEPVQEVPAPALVATDAAIRADARPAPSSPAAATPSTSETYKVKAGDTFWSISRKYGTSVEAVMKANGIKDARRLRVGMSLTIPQ